MRPTPEEKMVEKLLILWIGKFLWSEDPRRTDAIVDIVIEGMEETPLDVIVDLNLVNEALIRRVVHRMCRKMTEFHSIDELLWRKEAGDANGPRIVIQASVHLADPS